MPGTSRLRLANPAWLGLDAVAVLVFVAVGRRSHQEGSGLAAVASTATPFLIALVAAWGVARAWRQPAAAPTGLAVAAGTLAGGMALRRFAFGDGTAPSFIVVAAIFLLATMVGWRAAAARLTPTA